MEDQPTSRFAQTRWTLVQRAGGTSPEAKAALRELCEIYYAPVVSFIRHWRHDRDDDAARDSAHAFFESLLLRDSFGQPRPQDGRFRSYLLGAVKNFLREQHRVSSTAKRGGGARHQALDEEHQIPIFEVTYFDRAWALAIIGHAIDELKEEMASTGKAGVFEALKPWLDGNVEVTQAEVADQLGMSETAVKVAIHRLRQRFRAKVRAGVSATLYDPRDLDEELSHLVAVLDGDYGEIPPAQ